MNSMHDTIQHGQHGFGLVESLVALVVISVGMIGIAAMYGQGLSASRTAFYRTTAVHLTSDMADRIRVNRLGGAAYAGGAADNNCDAGVDCTPAQMAAHELFVWNQQVQQQLPNGQWLVQFAAGDPPTYTISVQWDEPSAAVGTVDQQIIIQVPEI
jgi:type IV pilus assembly protein PilV